MSTKTALLLTCCLLPTVGMAQTTNPASQKRVTWELRLPLIQVIPAMTGTFSNIPKDVRTIPQHQDDDWFCCAGRPRVVPDETVDTVLYSNLSLAIAPQFNFRRGTLIFGANLSGLQMPIAVKGSYWTTLEVNQNGTSERGTGTSLVGTAIVSRKRLRAYPFIEWEFSRKKSPDKSFIVGYSYSRVGTSVRAFYDRWDKLETYKNYSIMESELHSIYASLYANRFFLLTVGPVYQRPHLTALGHAMEKQLQRWSFMITLSPRISFGKESE